MSKATDKAMDALQEAALQAGDMDVIRKMLFERGYRPHILLKGANDVIKMECAAGGKGVSAQHVWKTTPLEALSDDGGCPHCKLEEYIAGPAEEVPEAVLIAAIKKQHKAISDSDKLSRKKMTRSSGNNFGLDHFAV